MKENISIQLKNTGDFISYEEILALAQQSVRHLDSLIEGTGTGNDFLGWLTLPEDIALQLDRIGKVAKHLRDISRTTVVTGIGGSYLGAKAVIEGLSHSFPAFQKNNVHEMIFAGQNISEDYTADLLEILEDRDYSIIVISKSGTTTEPALAFRILKDHLEKKTGKREASERIVAITDSSKGALHSLAVTNKYKTFIIPDNIGGRYSVLSPVGLLPIAVSGADIRNLISGAEAVEKITRDNRNGNENPTLLYAATRNLLLQTGRPVEILVSFTPRLNYFAEWWKQLFGESEGKEGKGIFPASAGFTTDLHSLGQYIQEGQRILFETMISVKEPGKVVTVPFETDDSDQLNYLAGKRLSEINLNAEAGTIAAHTDGKVPVIRIEVPQLDEFYFGQLIYFFELACAVSGYILDVNPFDQPGVEAYKKNMFALLNKPGFEEAGKKLRRKLG